MVTEMCDDDVRPDERDVYNRMMDSMDATFSPGGEMEARAREAYDEFVVQHPNDNIPPFDD